MRKVVFLLVVLVCSAVAALGQQATEGSLFAAGKKGNDLGACPLKTTAVKTDVSGFLARVNVRQEFQNSFSEPIEAVYVFPLSQNGAVDRMTMTVGSRVIRGRIMKREDARKTYETAKSEGKTASLLDQERVNIFTQSVANIMPGETVVVEISYIETLKYEDGAYEFVFPMTIGPRYIPGGVKDAAKIAPPIAETRNGSDISIEVNLNAGVPVEDIRSTSHAIDRNDLSPNASRVVLRGEKTIPNKDFILRYDVTGKRIEDALLTHRDERGGFFTLILQPPDMPAAEDRTPKEIVFVLDTSGSMEGFPIEKAKEAMKLSLDGLYPEDTFNIITFAGDTSILFEKPVPATRANLDAAQAFLAERRGYGGTEMMKAIKASLDPSDASDHLRIVCFMTDGMVGNEDEIIAEVQRHPNARVFSFGIGSSVNRLLLDKIAAEGKGEAAYVALEDDGSKAARKFYERVRSPLLTDLAIDWNGLPVADVYPAKLTDLFTATPVTLYGRYTKAASGVIKLKGKVAGQPYERTINIDLPESAPANDSLATLWARTRVDELSMGRLNANPKLGEDMDKQILGLGLEFGIMTKFTSFVAVEDRVANPNGAPATVEVPNVLPEGMDPKNADTPFRRLEVMSSLQRPPAVTFGNGSGSGPGSGSGLTSATAVTVSSSASQVVNVTATTVDVTSDDEPVSTSGTRVASNITTQQIQNLPMQGRNFTSLLTLTPGLTSSGAPGFSVDGSSGAENVFVIDGSEVTNFRTGTLNKNNGTPLTGRTVLVVQPTLSKETVAAKARGKVDVEIRIDRDGAVTSATAVRGDKRLRDAAVTAAKLTRFGPTVIDGFAVRMTGTITYDFKEGGAAEIFLKKMKAEPLSDEDKRAAALASKMHFWVYDLAMRLEKASGEPTANEARFVRDGNADVRVELNSRTAAVVSSLRSAGLEVTGETGKSAVTGRISVARLASLAAIEAVTLILPASK
ncbi:MAG: TonB family protein [Pyrinomonadaceae bacterium]|nr:TonB family protein [Pyrinomonadaceae bacterium]